MVYVLCAVLIAPFFVLIPTYVLRLKISQEEIAIAARGLESERGSRRRNQVEGGTNNDDGGGTGR